MLLHEALKYPNLEKVVGLELDQTVTRKCFKYFKTSPHFDDPRVEWWFGDATKSLLLLPEEYWGSFDLVLVDLSETVVSFSVTKELDVFDAMALLLNPQGVLVKNEHYMEKLSSAFDYSVELFYESPVICSQTLAFGSNTVDFFHDPVYDHGIETKLYGTMHTPTTRFDLMHDYRKNTAPKEKCDLKIPELPALQEKTAGVLEIVNAEQTIDSLANDISSILKNAAEEQGLSVLFDPMYAHDTSIVVMSEGYIAARTWPDIKYVSFDIYLWGKTYKVEALKTALIKAVESKDVSAYKVVVGGMFGSKSWMEDQKIIGPKLKQLRNCDGDVVTTGQLDPVEASLIAFEEIVPLTLSTHVTAAVVCGSNNEDCTALKAIQDHEDVKQVIPIYDCPGMGDNDSIAFACEIQVLADLRSALATNNSKLDLLVIDPSSSYKMNQIIASITSIKQLRLEFMASHFIAASWMTDMSETWRRDLIDRFRKQFHYDPASHAEVLFQSNGKAHQLGVFSSNNDKVNYEYKNLESRLQQRLAYSKATIELRKIHGALYQYKKNWRPKTFKQSDYFSAAIENQFRTQQPLGRQNIIQLVKAYDYSGALELNLDMLAAHLTTAMTGVGIIATETKQFVKGLGEGGIVACLSPAGDVILVWDGREHVDISLFTDGENNGLPEIFIGHLFHLLDGKMAVGLRDDQPRGIGRVINFASDLEDDEDE
jgi:S-adenosylmethionine/arginine decarboxylase-like enzyme